MITEKFDPGYIPKYGILRVKGNMQVQEVKDRKIALFKEPPLLVYSGLTKVIGNPVEYEKKETDQATVDLTIPLEETTEHAQSQAKSPSISVCSSKQSSQSSEPKL